MQYLAVIFIFLSAYAYAAPQYRRDCSGTFIRPEQLEITLVPEALKLTEVTGLRVLELKSRVIVPSLNHPVGPSSDESAKFEQARKLSVFLQTFPLEFLRKHPDLCFVLTDRMYPYGALAISNIMLIPVGAPLDTIAHEMSHVIDNLNITEARRNEWDAINARGNCTFAVIENPTVSNPGLHGISPCFVSEYARRNRSEDRAEVFAAMVQDFHNLIRKTPANSSLSLKIVALKKYYQSIHPEMDDGFWINRPASDYVGRYNSCGSSIENDQSCRFDQQDPLNRHWNLNDY